MKEGSMPWNATVRWAALAWLTIWISTYALTYPVCNFLNLCDLASLMAGIGLWRGNPLLLSAAALSSLVVGLVWVADVAARLALGHHLIGGTEYLWDPHNPLFARLLSGFHAWLPIVVLWALRRVGYDRRALALQSAIAIVAVALARACGPGANINFSFRDPLWHGPLGTAPVHVAAIVAGAVAVAYLPTHLLLRRLLPAPSALAAPARRTTEDVLRVVGPARRPGLEQACRAEGLAYPPQALVLVGLKEERILEAWGRAGSGWRRLRAYPILAASGGPGPKLREGDLQVPEGLYDLTLLNPNSRYHLSIKVGYPSAVDRERARQDGRESLGGDIFIHGRAVSIGCIAIGDDAIEELFTLVADVGLGHSRIVIAPSLVLAPADGLPSWTAPLYDRIRRELLEVRGSLAAKP
jgi:hypothetical protein